MGEQLHTRVGPGPSYRRRPAHLRNAVDRLPSLLILFALAALASVKSAMALELEPSSVPPGAIVAGGPRKDGIPALEAPAFIAADASADVEASDLVVGISVDGEARAYPIDILNWHEIANDTLAETPVTVSWCPLTHSAVAFRRSVERDAEGFGVSGRLFESNLLLYDRATQSLWSQLGGRAVTGPRLGERWNRLPTVVTTWQAWRRRHPETTVMTRDTGHQREYDRDPYADYPNHPSLYFPVSHRDGRLPSKALVLGYEHQGQYFAHRLRGADPQTVAGDPPGGVRMIDPGGLVVDADETPVVATVAYWFAWSTFHPDTVLAGTSDARSATIDVSAVRIENVEGRWTGLLMGMLGGSGTIDRPGPNGADPTRAYVVSGRLRSVSDRPIRAVVLRYELLDAQGAVLDREEGYNRRAEAYGEIDESAIESIPPGGQDTFRIAFFADETPEFSAKRVRVVSVQYEDRP